MDDEEENMSFKEKRQMFQRLISFYSILFLYL